VQFMSPQQKDLLSRLHRLADGNATLVDEAIRHAASLEPSQRPKLGVIVRYILRSTQPVKTPSGSSA
jgi:hypothetical protein